MGVDDVFNYVMETPGNTNPNILRSLLNNLDGGGSSGSGVLVVNVSDGALDKTYSEILASTTPVTVHKASEVASYWGFVTAVFEDDGEYTVVVTDSSAQAVSYYIADSADGYPETEAGLPDGGSPNVS